MSVEIFALMFLILDLFAKVSAKLVLRLTRGLIKLAIGRVKKET